MTLFLFALDIALTVAVIVFRDRWLLVLNALVKMTSDRDFYRDLANTRNVENSELRDIIHWQEAALFAAEAAPNLPREPEQTPFDAPQFHEAAAPTGELLPSQWLGSADEMTAVQIGCAVAEAEKAGAA